MTQKPIRIPDRTGSDPAPAVRIDDLDVGYGALPVIRGLCLNVAPGRITAMVGANGSGKSTLLNALAGIVAPSGGRIELFGERIDHLAAHAIVTRGLALAPEGRRVFRNLTVLENLLMGGQARPFRKHRPETLERIFEWFPRLKDRRRQSAGTLSGGEQQMLALGRALMSRPRVLMCDELSLGLAPAIIDELYRRLVRIGRDGTTVILVEQDLGRAMHAADRVCVMRRGEIVMTGRPDDLDRCRLRQACF